MGGWVVVKKAHQRRGTQGGRQYPSRTAEGVWPKTRSTTTDVNAQRPGNLVPPPRGRVMKKVAGRASSKPDTYDCLWLSDSNIEFMTSFGQHTSSRLYGNIMFQDKNEFAQLASLQIRSASEFLAMAVNCMDAEAVKKIAAHMEKGAQLSVSVIAPPTTGGPTTLELALVHPTAGRLVLQTATARSGANTTPPHQPTAH